MEKRATYDDAHLILKLYDMRREDRLRQARQWFAANFKVRTLKELDALCPPGSDANASYRMVTSYWEMVASFIRAGVLNEELFYQSGRELAFVWERIRDVVPEMRKAFGDDAMLKNVEEVASSLREWANRRSPGSYEAFSTRVRGA